MMRELEDCYRVLDLEPGASMEEVNQAYKDLVFIWHPDRIPKDNVRLHQKAQEKLKQINQARDKLRRHRRDEEKKPRSRNSSSASSSSGQSSSYSTYRRDRGYPRTYKSQPSTSFDTGWSYSSYAQYYSSADTQAQAANGSSTPPASRDRTPTNQSDSADPNPEDLHGADLRERDLSGRNLSHANLRGADLSDAFLHKINLSQADLSEAKLFRANLLQANLREANLQNANLIGADLSGADLTGANLTGAKVGFSDKIMVKLTGAILTGATMPDGSTHP